MKRKKITKLSQFLIILRNKMSFREKNVLYQDRALTTYEDKTNVKIKEKQNKLKIY